VIASGHPSAAAWMSRSHRISFCAANLNMFSSISNITASISTVRGGAGFKF
jgi:hypothetical protein